MKKQIRCLMLLICASICMAHESALYEDCKTCLHPGNPNKAFKPFATTQKCATSNRGVDVQDDIIPYKDRVYCECLNHADCKTCLKEKDKGNIECGWNVDKGQCVPGTDEDNNNECASESWMYILITMLVCLVCIGIVMAVVNVMYMDRNIEPVRPEYEDETPIHVVIASMKQMEFSHEENNTSTEEGSQISESEEKFHEEASVHASTQTEEIQN